MVDFRYSKYLTLVIMVTFKKSLVNVISNFNLGYWLDLLTCVCIGLALAVKIIGLVFRSLSLTFLSTRVSFDALDNFDRSLRWFLIVFLFNNADLTLLFSTRLSAYLGCFQFTVVISNLRAIITTQVLWSWTLLNIWGRITPWKFLVTSLPKILVTAVLKGAQLLRWSGKLTAQSILVIFWSICC